MINLPGPIKYLSEGVTVWRYQHGNDGLEDMAVEIMRSRALSRVRKSPNVKTVEDALVYMPKEQVVAIVEGYLQEQIRYNKQNAAQYSEKLAQLQKLEKPSGWQRSNARGLDYAANEHSRLQTLYEGSLQTLKSQGITAFVAEWERVRPQLNPML